MRVLTIGSLNVDEVYSVDRFVRPGETLACRSFERFPGGKGANQSLALARAGAEVHHAGKLGADGAFLRELLEASGADCSRIRSSALPTGRAVIQVDAAGQNCILLYGGANRDIGKEDIEAFLGDFGPGDAVLLQNEVSGLDHALAEASRRGLEVFLNPSPITPGLLALPLREADWLILNEVEGAALAVPAAPRAAEPGQGGDPGRILEGLRARFPRARIVLTLGAEGVRYAAPGEPSLALPAEKVEVVDTTAAGDTFTGYLVAALARKRDVEAALRLATRAAALCVGRKGAASSVPWLAELRGAAG